jgi:hypothetical protein
MEPPWPTWKRIAECVLIGVGWLYFAVKLLIGEM